VVISPPNFTSAKVKIAGTAPYVSNKFSSENRKAIIEKQEAGSRSRKGRGVLAPKDFDQVYRSAMHVSTDGWLGIPASSIRAAMVEACSIVGFHMTKGKKALFVEADGIDADDGTPLIEIIGEPTRRDVPVKLADGSTTMLARPFFDEWSAEVVITWDADMFGSSDIVNLLARAGRQVGIGAGRPASKNSVGCGWGTFKVED
jgi:hypothetical protein